MPHSLDHLTAIAERLAWIHHVDVADFASVALELYSLGYRGLEYENEIPQIMEIAGEIRRETVLA